jgi:ribosomal protein S27AE
MEIVTTQIVQQATVQCPRCTTIMKITPSDVVIEEQPLRLKSTSSCHTIFYVVCPNCGAGVYISSELLMVQYNDNHEKTTILGFIYSLNNYR